HSGSHSVMPRRTYCESVYTRARTGRLSARITAVSSMRLLVVRGSAPWSSFSGEREKELHGAEPLTTNNRANHRRQLHAVVGRQGLGAMELFLALARLQQRRPAPGPRIAAAGAVGIDLDHARERVVGLTRPPITAGFSRV